MKNSFLNFIENRIDQWNVALWIGATERTKRLESFGNGSFSDAHYLSFLQNARHHVRRHHKYVVNYRLIAEWTFSFSRWRYYEKTRTINNVRSRLFYSTKRTSKSIDFHFFFINREMKNWTFFVFLVHQWINQRLWKASHISPKVQGSSCLFYWR